MKTIQEQKAKLERKKLKLAIEENRLKEKERKMRTRHLIEVGGLLVKARLDYLPKATLYGALLSASSELDQNPNIIHSWQQIGKDAFEKEQAEKFAVIHHKTWNGTGRIGAALFRAFPALMSTRNPAFERSSGMHRRRSKY